MSAKPEIDGVHDTLREAYQAALINEEVGEIEQAYLEATHEDGDPVEVQGEIDDLGPLLMQLVESVRTHPMAFEPLPTAEDLGSVTDT